MSSIAVLIVVVTLAAIVVGIVVLARQGHPEDTATHDTPGGPDDPAEGPTDAPYPPGARPAGPGAESMAPEPDPRPSDLPDGPGQG